MKKKIYNITVCILCVVSVMFAVLDFSKGLTPLQTWIDNIIYGIFVLDYIIRLAVADQKKKFFKENLFDLIAILPFNSAFRIFRILKFSKVLRFAKFTKLFRIGSVSARFLTKIRRFLTTNGFKYVLILSGSSILAGTFAMMYFEQMTFQDALWWSFVTATTVGYIDIKKAGNPNAYDRKPFNKSQIKTVWKAKDSNTYMSVVLILIYTGVRIGELLDLEKKDIHLDERWFFVKESKTEAGIREVPIAEKIVPFFEYWMSRDCDHLICTPDDKPFVYRNYYDSYWTPLMEELNLKHRPHDTRHTCISMLTEAGVDDRIIKRIVGHKGQGVTEIVYTHLELPIKLEAINKI